VQGVETEELSREISTGFIDLMEEMTRHRPEDARVHFNDDVVTIVAERTLTRVERALALKDADAALDHRRRLQKALCSRISDLVESATGRRVLSCLADHAVDPDVGVYNVIVDGPVLGEAGEAG
jgi:uncharacterized protein YbcI